MRLIRESPLLLLGVVGCKTVAPIEAFGINESNRAVSRRDVWISSSTTAGAVLASASLVNILTATSAQAAIANVLTSNDVERMRTGYQQINYLLDNFEQETTVCRENGGECKRDANSIRKALGLRSTTDPLFQIEKVFAKIKNMDLDPDRLDALYEAAESWNSATSMSNSMAFISQFGEYNPGGGKDEVLKYLIESKRQVLMAKDALKTIMTNLDIPIN